MKKWLIIAILLFGIACTDDYSFKHKIQDKDFVLMSKKESPNGALVIIEYQFDTGAFGYSRVFWAICPNKKLNDLNIEKYLLPDGYKALDWTEQSEAILEKWEPYYFKSKIVNLNSGEIFNGVRIIIK
jgi:hypothetical protein